MILFCCRRWLLLGLLLLAWCPPVRGAERVCVQTPAVVCATGAGVVLAESFNAGTLFSSRTRIVQAGAVFMCIALFIIMMRKLN